MPHLRIDTFEGRTDAEVSTLLDAVQRSVVRAFGVPERDRYQILHQHAPAYMVVQDTGLGISRTDKAVMVQVTSRPHTRDEKQAFYRTLCEELQASCGIAGTDVVVSIVQNTDEDWSFGHGQAQFLTGEL
jgi:phenylpyruvate tautomerase PptA (4-oxalocrotonate tautomerase family)